MNKGKVLKVRPGHDANCSSYAYMGGFLVGFVGYLLLLGVSVIVQLSLRTQKLRSEVGTSTRVALWVVPHLLALAAFLSWAFTSGAMDYGSIICVGPLALLMLIGMGVGWTKITAKPEAAQEEAWILCPNCGHHAGSRSAGSCPECGFDLTAARLALFESRVAAGLCPKCGEAVASTDENCPSCGINVAWAREYLKGLAE